MMEWGKAKQGRRGWSGVMVGWGGARLDRKSGKVNTATVNTWDG